MSFRLFEYHEQLPLMCLFVCFYTLSFIYFIRKFVRSKKSILRFIIFYIRGLLKIRRTQRTTKRTTTVFFLILKMYTIKKKRSPNNRRFTWGIVKKNKCLEIIESLYETRFLNLFNPSRLNLRYTLRFLSVNLSKSSRVASALKSVERRLTDI